MSAYEALTEIARHDIQFVAEAATTALSGAAPHAAVTQLDFGAVDRGSVPRHQVVKLLGPPVARACTPRPSAPWIRVAQVPGGLDISVDTGGTGDRQGSIVLEGPTGRAVIAVQTTLVPAAPPTVPAPTFTPVPGAVAAAPAAAPRAASEASGADAPPAAAAAQVTEPPPRLAAAVKRQPEVRMPGLDPYLGIIRRPTRYYFGALVLLLITFCIVAAILLSETLSLDPDWAVVAVSGLGIVVALGDVRKNALTSSFLLWNLGVGAIYWIIVATETNGIPAAAYNPAYELFGYSADQHFGAACAIAAVGNGALCVWAVVRKGPRLDVRWHILMLAGPIGVTYLLAAFAWVHATQSGWGYWNVTAFAAIATVMAGLAVRRAFRDTRTAAG